MANGLATAHPYDKATDSLFCDIIGTYCAASMEKAKGQPFALLAIHKLATMAGDPDAQFALDCFEGLPLGVEEILLPTGHVWPSKVELTGANTKTTWMTELTC
jgi:hypothetical protein